MGEAEPAGAKFAGPPLHARAIVLDQRREHLVQQVQARGDEAPHHHWIPQPRQVPRPGAALEHERVLQGLQLPSRLEDEPREEVRRLVNQWARIDRRR